MWSLGEGERKAKSIKQKELVPFVFFILKFLLALLEDFIVSCGELWPRISLGFPTTIQICATLEYYSKIRVFLFY